jgi:ABC-type sulfate/molybdate transport systems ATPase subunit
LSGGEKQRIALARLLVSAPRLLLLDEPYSNLDAIHKNILKYVMQDISEQLNITCLLVSHDPVDVLSWADEILVLQEGKIVQKASPEKVYNQPVNEYVAALFGKYNVMNFALAKAFFAVSDIEMNKINSFFRPQHFKIVSNANEGLQATVKRVLFLGTYYEIEISITGSTITINTINNSLKIGDVVYVTLA